MIKNILITGGCGFIGSNLVNHLAERGFKVFIIDNLSEGSKLNLIKSKNIYFFKTDINNINSVKIKKKIDCCIHLAAKAEIMIEREKEDKYFLNNITGLQRVLNFCAKKKVKKFIFASSASVYGDTLNLKVNENKKKNPLHFYGYTKALGEEIVINYCKINKIKYFNLRFFNVYGNKSNAVIAKFLAQYLQGKLITIYGSGNQSRDFIHVDDLIQIIKILLKKNINSNVFNVGSAKNIKINSIKDLISTKAKSIKLPKRFDDIEKSISNNNKIKKVLNWKPKIELKEGLKKMINEDYLRLKKIKLSSISNQRKLIKKFNSQK